MTLVTTERFSVAVTLRGERACTRALEGANNFRGARLAHQPFSGLSLAWTHSTPKSRLVLLSETGSITKSQRHTTRRRRILPAARTMSASQRLPAVVSGPDLAGARRAFIWANAGLADAATMTVSARARALFMGRAFPESRLVGAHAISGVWRGTELSRPPRSRCAKYGGVRWLWASVPCRRPVLASAP